MRAGVFLVLDVENATLETPRKSGVPVKALFSLCGCDGFRSVFLAFGTRLRLDVEPTVQKLCEMTAWTVKRFLLHGPRWLFAGFLGGATRFHLDVENATRDLASGVFLWGFTNCVGSFDVYS